eukprot:2675676-Amphidinium_carterae.1
MFETLGSGRGGGRSSVSKNYKYERLKSRPFAEWLFPMELFANLSNYIVPHQTSKCSQMWPCILISNKCNRRCSFDQ